MTETRMNELCTILDSGIVPDRARKYIAAGFKVFPLRPFYENSDGAGKRPATKNGFKDASSDAKTVGKWWQGEHSRDNIGIPTGEGNNLLVIDLDVHSGKDGAASLKRLEEQYGALPETRTVRTGSGGRHLWFRYPQGHDIACSAGKAGEGIDVRANGGYVVAPPSVHACGNQYLFETDTGIATLPESWVKFLESLSNNDSKKGGEPFTLPNVVPQGQRNDVLFRYACALWAKGHELDTVRKSVERANDEKCKPPMTAGELDGIIKSMQRYERGKGREVYTFVPQGDLAIPADFSDAGDARAFVQTFGQDLLFVSGKTRRGAYWVYWDGVVYRPSWAVAQEYAKDYSLRLLKYAQQEVLNAAPQSEQSKAAERLASHAQRLRNDNKLCAMLAQASSELTVGEEVFDADPWSLNTPAGIIDLRTGECKPNDRAARCRNVTVADPTAQADSHMWAEFVDLVTCGDVEFAEYLQNALGMALIGKTLTEGLFVAYNQHGRNGKSTFFNAILHVLGEYGGIMNAAALTTAYTRDKENANVALVGRRVIVAPESNRNAILDAAEVKNVGSTDKLHARHLFSDAFAVNPTHTVFMFTNRLPKVEDAPEEDGGTWARLRLLPFDATMPQGDACIMDYAAVLAEQAGGEILRWLLDGAKKYIANGCHLPPCAAVEAATDGWKRTSSPIADFIDECTDITHDEADTVPAGKLYQTYKGWGWKQSRHVVRQDVFNKELEKLGVNRVTDKWRNVAFVGIKLL